MLGVLIELRFQTAPKLDGDGSTLTYDCETFEDERICERMPISGHMRSALNFRRKWLLRLAAVSLNIQYFYGQPQKGDVSVEIQRCYRIHQPTVLHGKFTSISALQNSPPLAGP
jgi:hypothetical protein